jgi:iron complex outermembrane receptor protein
MPKCRRAVRAALVLFVCFGSTSAAAQDAQAPFFAFLGRAAISLPAIVVNASPAPPIPPFDIETQPTGQTVTDPRYAVPEPAGISIGDILRRSPGISIKQGNGPRCQDFDTRSNARRLWHPQHQVFEDGFR